MHIDLICETINMFCKMILMKILFRAVDDLILLNSECGNLGEFDKLLPLKKKQLLN